MWMDMLTLTLYIVNLLSPALFIGLFVSFFKFNSTLQKPLLGLLGRLLINFLVGSAVLLGGIIMTGEDGKMYTYATLVVCVAATQWVLVKGWIKSD